MTEFNVGDMVYVTTTAEASYGEAQEIIRGQYCRVMAEEDEDGDLGVQPATATHAWSFNVLSSCVDKIVAATKAMPKTESFYTTNVRQVEAGDIVTVEIDGYTYVGPVYTQGDALKFGNDMLVRSDGTEGPLLTFVKATGQRESRPELPAPVGSVIKYGGMRLMRTGTNNWTTENGLTYNDSTINNIAWIELKLEAK